ncbi:MAG TPA: hypothetical protein VFL12_03240, partial [Thermoanaerobaculia bacterium]|nr:hypothetical protein [Thermoanaerobaculia bacterium]
MRSKSQITGILALALFAAGLSACATAATPPPATQTLPPPPPPPPSPPVSQDCGSVGDHVIDIGATINCKWAPVHTNANGKGNLLHWKSDVSGMNVRIWFDSSPFQDPLKNCDG